MYNQTNETMNESDEVRRWVHWKYGMSQIIQKLHAIEKKTAPPLMSPMMFDWIEKIINDSDALPLTFSAAKSKESMYQASFFPSAALHDN